MPTRLRARAPAKINLGLEVLGRRPDGFHEVVTIMQAIDLCDEFEWKVTGRPFRYTGADDVPPEDDLVARALSNADTSGCTGTLRVHKRIPAAAGLGGGSSDAALALRIALPDAPFEQLAELAATLGADVPFFLRGGAALARGTGAALTPLQSLDFWVVLLTPPLLLPDKTRRLYGGLTPADYGDGTRVEMAAQHLDNAIGVPVPNAFERQMRGYDEVARAWDAIASVTGGRASLSGAGPTLYALFKTERAARSAAGELPPELGAINVARTLPANFDALSISKMAAAVRGTVQPL
jgi:4-diphosphocytidyl-2-C-methyl-D-erythritol kinase